MKDAIPVAWQYENRGFWTKRKKTATSLLTVLTLMAGMAVAFKLFDRSVPNNVVRDAATFDFEVYKQDGLVGDQAYVNTNDSGGTPIFESGPDTFPGDARTVDVKIHNTNVAPEKDATFFVYVDQAPGKIRVTKCSDVGGDGNMENDFNSDGSCAGTVEPVAEGTQQWTRFVTFWTLEIDKEDVLTAGPVNANADDHRGDNHLTDLQGSSDPDASGNRQYSEACSGSIRSITRNAPCNLGTVKGFGSQDSFGGPRDIRYYKFDLVEADDGTDQSPFRGWSVTFDLVFQARVPALAEQS